MKVNKKILSLIMASMIATSQTSLLFADGNSQQTKEKIKEIEQNKATINQQTKEVDSLIDSTNTKLHTTQKELESTLASKIENEKLLEQTKEDLEEGISNLKDKMVSYYMGSYSANNSALEMVLKSESISDYIITSTHLEKIVNKQDELVNEVETLYEKQNKIVDEIKENEKELKTLKDKLDKDINNLIATKGEYENSLKELNKKQEELEDILIIQEEEEERIRQEIIAAQLRLEKEREEAARQEAEKEKEQAQTLSSNQSNQTTSNSNESNSTNNSSNSASWRTPLNSYRVTSKFGYRTHPVTGQWSLHGGIDLAAPTGTPTYSVKSGTVITSSYASSYGNYIIIDHGDGFASLYAHLSERGVSVGTKVSKGQYIGAVGSTGRSTGPHLHFEIRQNGQRVNPENFLRFS